MQKAKHGKREVESGELLKDPGKVLASAELHTFRIGPCDNSALLLTSHHRLLAHLFQPLPCTMCLV